MRKDFHTHSNKVFQKLEQTSFPKMKRPTKSSRSPGRSPKRHNPTFENADIVTNILSSNDSPNVVCQNVFRWCQTKRCDSVFFDTMCHVMDWKPPEDFLKQWFYFMCHETARMKRKPSNLETVTIYHPMYFKLAKVAVQTHASALQHVPKDRDDYGKIAKVRRAERWACTELRPDGSQGFRNDCEARSAGRWGCPQVRPEGPQRLWRA